MGMDTCLRCGSSFARTKPWQKFCTSRCRDRHNNARRRLGQTVTQPATIAAPDESPPVLLPPALAPGAVSNAASPSAGTAAPPEGGSVAPGVPVVVLPEEGRRGRLPRRGAPQV